MTEESNSRRQREVINLLLKEQVIDDKKLEAARAEAKRTGLRIDKALEKLGFITEEDIVRVQSSALGLPYVDLSDYAIDKEVLQKIPEEIIRKHRVIPLFAVGNSLTVGMVDPQDIVALDQVRRASRMGMVDPVLVSEAGLQKVIDAYLGIKGSTLIDEIAQSVAEEAGGEAKEEVREVEVQQEAPVVKLVNTMVAQAVQDRTSDIHIEPEEEIVRVRSRIDGVLREVSVLPKTLQGPITSRIKVLARMDIAESRRPQDGRIRMKIDNKDLDIRVSTFPTVHGENVVMRLLDRSSVMYGLQDIGFSRGTLDTFSKLIYRPNGIILVTGPTGSGKTSTLYSALSTISSMEKNIITIEDPVEYELPLIRQTQVNPRAGITFASGLRSILRQDPDIIMVGEIRDKETVDVAIQASLTGHLVFATLHTNDAPSALTRLMDMGVDPFLISSSVIGILAQRLVRTLCSKCKKQIVPEAGILRELAEKEKATLYQSGGCDKCQNTGFQGRMGIFELLVVDSRIRKLIDQRKSADEIKEFAVASGLKTLYDDGLRKVAQGRTALEEVLRVTTS